MTTAAVTGADGFIGSHLVEALVRRGDRVRAMVQYNSFNSWGWLESVPARTMRSVEVIPGDIRDQAAALELAQTADVVYHLAALIAIPYSYRSPRSYIETNVLGTLNVMNAARQLGIARVVHTSTSEVYGTARSVPIGEGHALQAQSPYAASKIGADKVAESFHHSFGLPVVTLRPFNAYGPRQSARAVIPTILSQLVAGAAELRLGDRRPTRDFTFVDDTVRAFISVADAPAEAVVGQVLNAGSGSEISIGALAELLCEISGRKVPVLEEEARHRPPGSEVMRLVADSSRLRAATGWAPEHSLRDGLTETWRWMADPANLAGYKWARYNL
ncbi:MAG: SDR family NAD(P)-dependent oxidoreductase [Chloroflexota bacterium]|nr:MAG: SDR family NAD(P)-dependent oxidoreductase [Chloroflexota bacterium]